MVKILLSPLRGISISGIGDINLGDELEQVEKILGKPNNISTVEIGNEFANRAFYDQLEMRIDYNRLNQVDFIEFLFGPWPERTELSLYDINPFKIDAEDLIKLLLTQNDGKVNDLEAPHCYGFSEIGVGIWRQSIPTDIEPWIQEKKAKGEYEVDKNWLDAELEKSKHFWTVGLGRKEYS
jgi:catechol 2,3-dioxygenase-like lactoylglutathione lyase family enzyme